MLEIKETSTMKYVFKKPCPPKCKTFTELFMSEYTTNGTRSLFQGLKQLCFPIDIHFGG